MQTAATWGVAGSPGSGAIALAHTERTLRSVSAPSSVVRSIMVIAVSMAQALDVVLMERVPSPAARASAPTWSTPGSPCSHLVNEALVSASTPSSSRALAVAVDELTRGVYRPALNRWQCHGSRRSVMPRRQQCEDIFNGYRDLDDAAGVPVSYTHLRAHETVLDLVCRLL